MLQSLADVQALAYQSELSGLAYHLNKSGEERRQTGGRKAPDRGG